MSKQANAQNAKRALRHYLRMAAEANGLQWSWENDNEVDAIVDLIIEAAVQEAMRRTLNALPPSVQE